MSRPVLAFFGAFNPPTVAHVELARLAMERTGREGVVFVPSQSVYIEGEQGKDFAYTDEERLAMLRRVAATRPWMAVEDLELRCQTQPRTYDTLCRLEERGYAPTLLFGSDKLAELEHGWRHVEDIARRFGFVCLTRGGDDCARMLAEDPYLRALAPFIRLVETPEALRGVSSTEARRAVAQMRALQRTLAALVPEEALPLL